jgi:hypothetical protein
MGLFDRLKRGLEKTKQILRTDIRDLFRSGEILDEKLLGDFESRLIRTDMGVAAAGRIISRLRQDHGGRTVDVEAIWKTVREELTALLRGQLGLVQSAVSTGAGCQWADRHSGGGREWSRKDDVHREAFQFAAEARPASCAGGRRHISCSGC